jgi:hypothetical protein
VGGSTPLHALPRAELDRVPDCMEQVAHSRVADAVAALAHAAALYERTAHFTELVLNGEHALWFVVRSLCHEHSLPFEQFEAHARRAAALTEAVASRPVGP